MSRYRKISGDGGWECLVDKTGLEVFIHELRKGMKERCEKFYGNFYPNDTEAYRQMALWMLSGGKVGESSFVSDGKGGWIPSTSAAAMKGEQK